MIPNFDPTLYSWSAQSTAPNLYLRQGFGPETRWAHKAAIGRHLYVTGKITFQTDVVSLILFAAQKAWCRMRFEYPEVVQIQSGKFDASGNSIMQCELPQDEDALLAWSKRTLYFNLDQVDEKDMMNAAEEYLRRQTFTDSVGVCLHCSNIEPQRAARRLTEVAFSMRVDHGLADGIGAYILAGKYLKILGEELHSQSSDHRDWTSSKERIPKAWVQMLNPEQKTTGDEFEQNVRKTTELVLECPVSTLSPLTS